MEGRGQWRDDRQLTNSDSLGHFIIYVLLAGLVKIFDSFTFNLNL